MKALFSGADVFLCQGKDVEEIRHTKLDFNPDATHVLNNWTATRQLIEVGDNRSFKRDSSMQNYIVCGLDRGLQRDF